jgi:hypothetical protein
VLHSPPRDTACDVISTKQHVGSRAIRAFIEARQPRLVLSGHIHESPRVSGAWRDTLGRTPVVNPGQFGGPKLAGVWFDPLRPDETPAPHRAPLTVPATGRLRGGSMSILHGHHVLALDTETTGMSPNEGHRLVEVARVAIVDGALGEEWSTLVNPGRPIPPDASRVPRHPRRHGGRLRRARPTWAERCGKPVATSRSCSTTRRSTYRSC